MGDLILVYNLLVMGSIKIPAAAPLAEALGPVRYLTQAENM
jgi:hypothetical protein